MAKAKRTKIRKMRIEFDDDTSVELIGPFRFSFEAEYGLDEVLDESSYGLFSDYEPNDEQRISIRLWQGFEKWEQFVPIRMRNCR